MRGAVCWADLNSIQDMDIVQQCLTNMYALARNAQSAIVKHISSITLSDVKLTQMHYLTGHGLKIYGQSSLWKIYR